MEWLDIYDEHGNRTGKTAERGTFLSKGEYLSLIHIQMCIRDRMKADMEQGVKAKDAKISAEYSNC